MNFGCNTDLGKIKSNKKRKKKEARGEDLKNNTCGVNKAL